MFFKLILLLAVFRLATCITTTHHDKPEDAKPSAMAGKMKETNLTSSERQKRLLPYMTFYLAQDFNRPQPQFANNQRYQQQPQTTFQQFHNKFNELTSHPQQLQPQPQQQHTYELVRPQKIKLTPFLESNALPGPFVPMRNIASAAPQPNYSAIYDKLAQLKLQQQRNQLAQSYNRYNQLYYSRKPASQIPAKTIIETYASTNIDVPDSYNDLQQVHHHQDHVLPSTVEEQQQYYADQKLNHEIKIKPIIIVRQPKPYKQYYQEQHKRPVLILQKKPQPKRPYNFQITNNNYAPVKFVPINFDSVTPKYIEVTPKYESNFIPIPNHYQEKPEVQYEEYESIEATPLPPQPQPQQQNQNSLGLILKKLQDMNALPHTLTPDNIDNSIRTLVRILSSLKKQQQKFSGPIVVPDESGEYEKDNEAGVGLGGESHIYPENTPEGGTPGTPGVDYPALSSIPQTDFNCKTQRYKGFFGDPDTNCQVWHYCDLNGGQASFLCPNGTIFSQVALTCDWWYNVKCSNTAQLYVLNERLYKYILPLSPKFPEDYSGPLVDRYLALKFKEMEEKMQKERKKNKENSSDKNETDSGDSGGDDAEDEQKEETTEDTEEDGAA